MRSKRMIKAAGDAETSGSSQGEAVTKVVCVQRD